MCASPSAWVSVRCRPPFMFGQSIRCPGPRAPGATSARGDGGGCTGWRRSACHGLRSNSTSLLCSTLTHPDMGTGVYIAHLWGFLALWENCVTSPLTFTSKRGLNKTMASYKKTMPSSQPWFPITLHERQCPDTSDAFQSEVALCSMNPEMKHSSAENANGRKLQSDSMQ